ncbi:MAG: HlyD family efflux transporter periplasmic adaptor subunit [Pseudomonadota bacterium]
MQSFDQHSNAFKTLSSIRMPKVITSIAALLILVVGAAALFVSLVPWVQTASGIGVVTALNPDDRDQDINALVSGRIDEWFVRDGSAVKRGDPIVKLSDNDPQLLDRLKAERSQVELQLEAAQSALVTAQRDNRRMTSLLADGLVSQRDTEQASLKVDDFRGRIAELNAQLNRLDVGLSRQSEQIVRAPRDGFILSVNAGDTSTYVSTGQTLARFVPDSPERVLQININGRDIALIQPGAEARIEFEGWPAVQFSGWPSVAVGTFSGKVVAVDPSAQPDGRFRVIIAEDPDAEIPWPEERFVRFGAGARAWILLETVPLGYELWRQMNAFPPTLPANTASTRSEQG